MKKEATRVLFLSFILIASISFVSAATCSDTDNGKNYYDYGTTCISGGSCYPDKCIGSTLKEFYCGDDGKVALALHPCSTLCSGGECACIDYYADADNDGYGDVSNKKCLYAIEGNYKVTQTGDCNDGNPNINSGKTEVCNDGIDNDCDLIVDEGCATTSTTNEGTTDGGTTTNEESPSGSVTPPTDGGAFGGPNQAVVLQGPGRTTDEVPVEEAPVDPCAGVDCSRYDYFYCAGLTKIKVQKAKCVDGGCVYAVSSTATTSTNPQTTSGGSSTTGQTECSLSGGSCMGDYACLNTPGVRGRDGAGEKGCSSQKVCCHINTPTTGGSSTSNSCTPKCTSGTDSSLGCGLIDYESNGCGDVCRKTGTSSSTCASGRTCALKDGSYSCEILGAIPTYTCPASNTINCGSSISASGCEVVWGTKCGSGEFCTGAKSEGKCYTMGTGGVISGQVATSPMQLVTEQIDDCGDLTKHPYTDLTCGISNIRGHSWVCGGTSGTAHCVPQVSDKLVTACPSGCITEGGVQCRTGCLRTGTTVYLISLNWNTHPPAALCCGRYRLTNIWRGEYTCN